MSACGQKKLTLFYHHKNSPSTPKMVFLDSARRDLFKKIFTKIILHFIRIFLTCPHLLIHIFSDRPWHRVNYSMSACGHADKKVEPFLPQRKFTIHPENAVFGLSSQRSVQVFFKKFNSFFFEACPHV